MFSTNLIKTYSGSFTLDQIFLLNGIDLNGSIPSNTTFSPIPFSTIIVFDRTYEKHLISNLVYVGLYSGPTYHITFSDGTLYKFTPDQMFFTQQGVLINVTELTVLSRLWFYSSDYKIGIYKIDVYDDTGYNVDIVLNNADTFLMDNGLVVKNLS